MKKIISIFLCSLLIVLSFSSFCVADTQTDEDNDLQKYVKDISEGKIKPVNEDPNCKVFTSFTEDNNIQDGSYITQDINNNKFKLKKQKITKDIRKIDSDAATNTNTYKAVIITDNTYEIQPDNIVLGGNEQSNYTVGLSDTKNALLVNVTMYGEIVYNQVYAESGNYAYKITQVKGGYMSSSDPQMICSTFELFCKYYGRLYGSTGVFVKSGGSSVTQTYNSPTKGVVKSLSTGQSYYTDCDAAGYNLARIYFTVKRTVSSYTNSSYIALGFGEVNDPTQGNH